MPTSGTVAISHQKAPAATASAVTTRRIAPPAIHAVNAPATSATVAPMTASPTPTVVHGNRADPVAVLERQRRVGQDLAQRVDDQDRDPGDRGDDADERRPPRPGLQDR